MHVEDPRQAMCDEVSKYQDPSQVFVQQKPEEVYNEKGELFLTILPINILNNMSVLNNFINSDTTHRLSKSRFNTLASEFVVAILFIWCKYFVYKVLFNLLVQLIANLSTTLDVLLLQGMKQRKNILKCSDQWKKKYASCFQ